ASERTYAGSNPIRNLQAQGFPGPVYPVNPRYDEVFGLRAYPSLEDLPEPPGATLLCVGVARVVELAAAALERGCRALVVPSGGYTDSGEEALRMSAKLARLAARYGAAVCGPN